MADIGQMAEMVDTGRITLVTGTGIGEEETDQTETETEIEAIQTSMLHRIVARTVQPQIKMHGEGGARHRIEIAEMP